MSHINISKLTSFAGALVLAFSAITSCAEKIETPSFNPSTVRISASLEGFEDDMKTKVNDDLDGFTANDRIRLMIICPHSTSHELGETWGSYYTTSLKADTNGEWYLDNSGLTVGSYEAQKTTYIYSAVYSPMTRNFVYNNYRYSRPSICFHADQRKIADYKSSDLIWAQSVMQTGAVSVHMNFRHKMARLDIKVDDSALDEAFSDSAILTLENMPDIDGAEVVVGDYYADESYSSDTWNRFNYREMASCSYENNGKVIGIQVIDDAAGRTKVYGMSGNPSPAGGNWNSQYFGSVPDTGTYTAYQDPSDPRHYMLLVPPCVLSDDAPAVFWLRDGSRRYSVTLEQKSFTEGHSYHVNLRFTN